MAASPAPGLTDGPSARILVIEDDSGVRGLLEALFLSEGYQVRAASSGLEGLTLAGSWRPDLVVLDLMLQDIAGEEVCHRLGGTPIVLVSATREEVRWVELGARTFIRKPFETDDLLDQVHGILNPPGTPQL